MTRPPATEAGGCAVGGCDTAVVHARGDDLNHLGVEGSTANMAVDPGGHTHIHQALEDLKGLTGVDGYGYGNKVPEGGGRSHGVTRRDRRHRGRFIATDTAARFWSKVHKTPGGCWVWTGALSGDGYGRFRVTLTPGVHRHVKAHRWAYQHLVGPIPAAWTLDHLTSPGPCASRACVRPDHLEPVTRAENARRAVRRRRGDQRKDQP